MALLPYGKRLSACLRRWRSCVPCGRRDGRLAIAVASFGLLVYTKAVSDQSKERIEEVPL